jgi:hypothetical protein
LERDTLLKLLESQINISRKFMPLRLKGWRLDSCARVFMSAPSTPTEKKCDLFLFFRVLHALRRDLPNIAIGGAAVGD